MNKLACFIVIIWIFHGNLIKGHDDHHTPSTEFNGEDIVDLIENNQGYVNHERHVDAILANLADPNPVEPGLNGSLIVHDWLVERTSLGNMSIDPEDIIVHYTDDPLTGEGANIEFMKKTMIKLFSKPRCHSANNTHKLFVRRKILDRFAVYTGETFCQEFTGYDKSGSLVSGTNLIGVIPGRLRGSPDEGVLVIGAHYDTVSTCPGFDDNGSGTMAVLETARLLSPKIGEFNHTLIFVAFDLEELGALGSIAFVNNYLIPKVLQPNKAKFLGAYIMDMILNYDPSTNAQTLPRDIARAAPEANDWVRRNNYMGDFVTVWSRRSLDGHLWEAFAKSWKDTGSPSHVKHKLLVIDPPIPRTPILFDNFLYRSFMRSDHASFWNHKNRAYRETLNAVLISDMGPWRGIQRACYHEFCDDESQLTTYNMEFVKHIVDSLVNTVINLFA